jgi:hypothetical protein
MFPSGSFPDTLRSWHDFFLLVGGASATLLGLVFISVALVSSLPQLPDSNERDLFAAPVLIQFLYALALAALSLAPWQSARVFGFTTALLGMGAFVQSVGLFVSMRRRHRARQMVSGGVWLQSVVAPLVIATIWLASAIGLVCGELRAVAGVATAAIALDLLGVMGAWNLFLWMLAEYHRRRA